MLYVDSVLVNPQNKVNYSSVVLFTGVTSIRNTMYITYVVL